MLCKYPEVVSGVALQMKKLAIVAWMYFKKQLFALYDRKDPQMGHPQHLEYHMS